MPDTILQAHGLTFAFSQQQVFRQFSAALPTGVTYVVGDESSGKTTLLRLFAADLTPQAGHLAIRDINQASDLASYKKHIFWVDPRSTAHDHISPNDYFDLQRRIYPAFDEALLATLIEGLSLSEHQAKAMYMLSAGSKRKVWITAAFASGATVTLLDEPFAALDKASIHFLIELLENMTQNTKRAWVVADYEAPPHLSVNFTINLHL
jgi:ABC-type multidrug transport system ATPase subunit